MHKELQVPLEHKDQQELQVRLVHKVQQEPLVHKDQQAQRVQQEI